MNAPEQPGIPGHSGRPRIPQRFLDPTGPFHSRLCFREADTNIFSVFFFFSFIGANAEVALGMLSLFEGVDERAAHGDFKGNGQHFKNTRRLS